MPGGVVWLMSLDLGSKALMERLTGFRYYWYNDVQRCLRTRRIGNHVSADSKPAPNKPFMTNRHNQLPDFGRLLHLLCPLHRSVLGLRHGLQLRLPMGHRASTGTRCGIIDCELLGRKREHRGLDYSLPNCDHNRQRIRCPRIR